MIEVRSVLDHPQIGGGAQRARVRLPTDRGVGRSVHVLDDPQIGGWGERGRGSMTHR